jgi:hypothetical protein
VINVIVVVVVTAAAAAAQRAQSFSALKVSARSDVLTHLDSII